MPPSGSQYESRDRDVNFIMRNTYFGLSTKLALAGGRYFFGTSGEDIQRDVGEAANSVGTGLSKAWTWARDTAEEYQTKRKREQAEQRARERREQAEQQEQKKREAKARHDAAQRQALVRFIKQDQLRAKKYIIRQQQALLRWRREVLARLQSGVRWRLLFLKREDVRDMGKTLLLRGTRTLGTHFLLSVCTKGLGSKFAAWLDHQNLLDGLQTGKDFRKVYNALEAAIDQLKGLLALDLSFDLYDAMDDMPATDCSTTDLDDLNESADQRLRALQEQNKNIEQTVVRQQNALQGLDGADTLKPRFGETGESRTSSNLIGPDGERTTWDEHGNLLDKRNHDNHLDPLECKPDPDPPAQPAPTTPDPPKQTG